MLALARIQLSPQRRCVVCVAFEGGHDVTLWRQLVHSDDIPTAGIVDISYKDCSVDQVTTGTLGF